MARSLLPMAVGQPVYPQLTHRHREQARSHSVDLCCQAAKASLSKPGSIQGRQCPVTKPCSPKHWRSLWQGACYHSVDLCSQAAKASLREPGSIQGRQCPVTKPCPPKHWRSLWQGACSHSVDLCCQVAKASLRKPASIEWRQCPVTKPCSPKHRRSLWEGACSRWRWVSRQTHPSANPARFRGGNAQSQNPALPNTGGHCGRGLAPDGGGSVGKSIPQQTRLDSGAAMSSHKALPSQTMEITVGGGLLPMAVGQSAKASLRKPGSIQRRQCPVTKPCYPKHWRSLWEGACSRWRWVSRQTHP
ncbi:hypothetical protein ALQ18_05161 [Pseudomonas marginalis pv. marginalis]|nr:hypothetical protein ALQ18_05161 [Pseudomonas marginalis pv. marginalis]